jgi:hypothetical protein
MSTRIPAVLLLIAACSIAIAQNRGGKTPPPEPQLRLATGITEAGRTDWKRYKHSHEGLMVKVDTSDKKFIKTPNYVVSLHGDGGHWNLMGTASVYHPTPQGFEVYVRWFNDRNLSPAEANKANWRVAWMAVEE